MVIFGGKDIYYFRIWLKITSEFDSNLLPNLAALTIELCGQILSIGILLKKIMFICHVVLFLIDECKNNVTIFTNNN
jgi:hypothetical protein